MVQTACSPAEKKTATTLASANRSLPDPDTTHLATKPDTPPGKDLTQFPQQARRHRPHAARPRQTVPGGLRTAHRESRQIEWAQAHSQSAPPRPPHPRRNRPNPQAQHPQAPRSRHAPKADHPDGLRATGVPHDLGSQKWSELDPSKTNLMKLAGKQWEKINGIP